METRFGGIDTAPAGLAEPNLECAGQATEQALVASAMLSLVGRLLVDEPSAKTIEPLLQRELWDMPPYAADDESVCEGFRLMRRWLESALPQGAQAAAEQLRAPWFRAFLGAGIPDAPPWQTYYTDKESLLFAEETLEVRRCYRAYGLEARNKNHEPDDHIGTMLVFLGHLASIESALSDAVPLDVEALARIRRDQADFLRRHVLTFVDVWMTNVATRVPNDFYQGVAHIARGVARRRYADLQNERFESSEAPVDGIASKTTSDLVS